MSTENLILKNTQDARKFYSFESSQNPRIISDYWFQDTIEGKTLFLVFYTQACRYSKCMGCNLPSKMSQHYINFRDIMKQIDSVFNNILDDVDKSEISKFIVSNNGSVLDEHTFSTSALIYLIAKINLECPNVKVVSLETRPEHVEVEELEVLCRALSEGNSPTALELAIGVEAFDDRIRNEIFNKGLNLDKIDKLTQMMAEVNERFHLRYPGKKSKLMLKTYFMLKPIPQLSEEDAIQDIQNGIEYLSILSDKYSIDVNMHLNPTYVAKGTLLEKEFRNGSFSPPMLQSVRKAVLNGKDKGITIFVGTNDENLAVEGGSFVNRDRKEDVELIEKLEIFNISQDYHKL